MKSRTPGAAEKWRPYTQFMTSERTFGVDQGVFRVPDDFDAALPDEELDAFEGGSFT